MKSFLKLLGSFLVLITSATISVAQTGVLNPNDPVVEYDPSNRPTQPPAGQIRDWVRTSSRTWNTESYKCYIYQGLVFRLKFPKTYQHNVADGKTYPLYIFFHGLGEAGDIYDNESQLVHGGEHHRNAVDNGTFDGFLMYPQNEFGFFGASQFDIIKTLIENYFVPQIKVDINRILIDGLSGGGTATWDFALRHPQLVAGALPISAASTAYQTASNVNILKYLPIWHFQGGRDGNPTPATARSLGTALLAAGASYTYTEYPNRGHSCWNDAWAEADYFPYMLRVHKANPIPLFGKYQFCEGETVNVTLGLTAGFAEYQWSKNGVVIPGATSNQYTVTSFGTYACRFRRGSVWSPWSPNPIVVKTKDPTVTPPITVASGMSSVIPSPASNSVTLELPTGYTSYLWQKVGEPATISTTNTVTVTSPGEYRARVTEQFGCISEWSTPFKVIDANGGNKPDPVTNLIVSAVSGTSLKVDWMDNPFPQNNETNFEIYQSETPGGPYTLAGTTTANVTTFTVNGLSSVPGNKYYFIIRAINASGASAVSEEKSGSTIADLQAPTAPGNLLITAINNNAVTLTWTASTDNLGVFKYDIYINGDKTYVTTGTSISCFNLKPNTIYKFVVKARDEAGNVSVPSNEVIGQTVLKGLNTKYYTGTWTSLPDFNTLTPLATGVLANVSISSRTQNDNFAFLWEGYINIPVTGNYTFRTRSDDGSRLWIGGYNYSTPSLVNNDGEHTAQEREGTILLTAGVYPIAIAFFHRTGTETMSVTWRTPQTGTSFVSIPDWYYVGPPLPTGAVPATPTNFSAVATSFNKISLSWTDTDNETGYAIERFTGSTFITVANLPANCISFIDSNLAPGTNYQYRIRSFNASGSSPYDKEGPGIGYRYYELSGMTGLPNFNILAPVKAGRMASFGLGIQNRSDNFAILQQGFISVPSNGTYTFYTTSNKGSKLYIGSFEESNLVVNNDGVHTSEERSGTRVLTAGTYPIFVSYFETTGTPEQLVVSYAGPGIPKQVIPASALGQVLVNATTSALPSPPLVPTNLVASASGPKSIDITWTNNANNADKIELYRSGDNAINFVLLATIDANATSYRDSGLFSNDLFYYIVRAVNSGGSLGYSNADTATTQNNVPVITAVPNQFMKYGTQLQISVTAADADNSPLVLNASNLPSFATFTPNGNGGVISFNNPSAAEQGTYPGITISATDQHSSTGSITFSLEVNDNSNPQLGAVSNVAVNEKETSQFNILATDQNVADVLTWSFTGLPSFATATPSGNSVSINLAPGYADHGVYTVIARIDDNHNGSDTASFVITVINVNPNKKIYLNFADASIVSPAPWNSPANQPAFNNNYPNLKDQTGNATSIGWRITSPWQNLGNGSNLLGVNTGNNSGIYPDAVMRSAYWTDVNPQTIRFYGLDPNSKYSFTFFGSRGGVTDNRTSNYTVKGTTVSLNAANNSQNTVGIFNVVPEADSSLVLTLARGAGSNFAYLNAMIIESLFDDGTTPAKAKNIAVQLTSASANVSWIDAAYNETAYEIYRSNNPAGPFALLNPGSNNYNTELFKDSSIGGSQTYYYFVRAINSYGSAPNSDTVSVTTPNVIPTINVLADVKMKTQQTVSINITVHDPGDLVALTAQHLPAFANLVDNGNGTGVLEIQPGNTMGTFNDVTITATDDEGASSNRVFKIVVTDKDITAIYVNFNQVVQPVDPVWNHFNSAPFAGKTISNLKNDNETATAVSVTLIDAWEGDNELGATTGNNTGVFPDAIMRAAYYQSNTAAMRIRISGLSTDPNTKYNLVFFASRSAGDPRNTTYKVGTDSVLLNAANNTTNTAQINGLVPNASGVIEFTAQKSEGSPFAYINALVIQSYVDNGMPIPPSGLMVAAKSKTSIQLNWSDKSGNEEGFEIYRSQNFDGPYSLIYTTAANATSYLNTGLEANTVYYYKVRGKKTPAFSEYSNIAGTSTYIFSVLVNFNRQNAAALPWNNTNRAPELNRVFSNLRNDVNNSTGINMTITKNFSGDNPSGMNTGNNSGIVPDNVMRSSYWLDYGISAELKISGLNHNWQYTFVFFGSRNGGGDRTTVYTINNKSVSLNASYNTMQTVQLDNVRADENGEVFIKISLAQYAQFGYLNGMMIHGYELATTGEGEPTTMMFTGMNEEPNVATRSIGASRVEPPVISTLKGYPNPFTDHVTLSANFVKPQPNVVVKLMDMSGRMVYSKSFNNVREGQWSQRLNFGGSTLPGIYFLQVIGFDEKPATFKLVKTR